MSERVKQGIWNNFVLVFVLAAIIMGLVSVYVYDNEAAGSFLQGFLFFCVGCFGVGAFFQHWIQPSADRIAEGLGWPKGSPFQKEVAAADGAFGILGVICGFILPSTSVGFFTATTIGASFMLFMMGVGHVLDIKKTGNRSPLNAGAMVYYGLLLPIVMVVLLILFHIGQ